MSHAVGPWHNLVGYGVTVRMASHRESVVETLLERFGRTYAEQAGIRLADKPSPLYELLVLATLLSARISADIAVAAARELFTAGYRTPQRMRQASWQDRVDALGRGGYRRYDERTSTMLGDAAEFLQDRWSDDLRTLREAAGGDPARIRELLTEFKGIGPVGRTSSSAALLAARAGRAFGIALIGLGLAQVVVFRGFGGLWLALIGWFLVTAARAEEQYTTAQRTLAGVTVRRSADRAER